MFEASALPIDHYPDFLARLPSSLDLEALAREHKAFQRARGVRSGTDLFRLSLARGPGGYSLQPVAAWAGEQGTADITDEALIQRLQGAIQCRAGRCRNRTAASARTQSPFREARS